MTLPQVAKWDIFEASFEGPAEGNPYVDVTLEATFSSGSRHVMSTFWSGMATASLLSPTSSR